MSGENPARILLVDDDQAFRRSTAELLRQEGYRVETEADAEGAVEALRRLRFDLILLDLRMPGTDGLGVVEVLRRWGETIPILMISGFGTIDAAVQAINLGADDFLTKPVDPDLLSARVESLIERRPSPAGTGEGALGRIVGRSQAMGVVYAAIRKVAPTDTTVLLVGETGTGKELVARAIHEESARASGPFVPVNCGAFAENLLESELFGHVRGAFTGAIREKEGLFEAARGGTIFLDEVSDVNQATQQRLLRVLQEKEVRRVGSVETRPVDVRVIAATNRNLREEVESHRFREDLFYRLNVFVIDLPPLRERASDVPLLVESLLAKLSDRQPDRAPLRCSPFALRMLRAYDWPGNVRELFAAVESAAIHAEGGRIEAQHLPREVRQAFGSSAAGDDNGSRYHRESEPADERAAIVAALEEADGVRTRAAELLGMGRTTLWRKMKQYGLDAANQ